MDYPVIPGPGAALLLVGGVYLALLAVSLFLAYWIIRLAVRHGSLDARRRWKTEEHELARQLEAGDPASQ
ncbi:hypothetical protein [Pseudokineococcus sp. 1T1Z-3]|uniref:hypothetical protein n=1 Tax=Pseudokineococcus sp. 1T1Z-3 TaxID=3132745 RepID=UPI0030A1BE8F